MENNTVYPQTEQLTLFCGKKFWKAVFQGSILGFFLFNEIIIMIIAKDGFSVTITGIIYCAFLMTLVPPYYPKWVEDWIIFLDDKELTKTYQKLKKRDARRRLFVRVVLTGMLIYLTFFLLTTYDFIG